MLEHNILCCYYVNASWCLSENRKGIYKKSILVKIYFVGLGLMKILYVLLMDTYYVTILIKSNKKKLYWCFSNWKMKCIYSNFNKPYTNEYWDIIRENCTVCGIHWNT